MKKIIFIFFIVIISGISAIASDRYLFPRLAASQLFSKYGFLKKSVEDTTIINKTEQIYIREDSSVNKIASQVTPAVVNIVSYSNQKGGVLLKNGTGMIITSDGIIMTYSSAIGLEDSSYKIMTNDGNVYDGELLGVDSWSNLAFLKINASNLPVIALANPDDHKPGEKIVAIENNLLNQDNRFAQGLLSSFNPAYNISGKALAVPEKLEGIFLTDLNFQFLASGGPVIDYSGQAVGIIGSTIRNGQTEYFVIPADKIEIVIGKAVKKELDTNPVLGIYYLPIDRSYALANNLDVNQGALIFSGLNQQGLAVISGTPAAKAGLKLGDIITKVNGEDITLDNNLSTILYKYKKGDNIQLTLKRGGQETTARVQL